MPDLSNDLGIESSTFQQYSSNLRKFKEWGGFLPCSSETLISFIQDKGSFNRENRLKCSTLKSYVTAVSEWHKHHGYVNPAQDPRIKKLLRQLKSLERQKGIGKAASRNLTDVEGVKLVSLLVVMSDTRKARHERLVAAISLLAGHRTGMIAQIKVDDMLNLGVPGTNIVINTPAFKTDVELPTVIPFTGDEFCPASWIREYINEHKIEFGYLFKSNSSAKGHIARHTVNEISKRVFKLAGIFGGKLTATSFRKTMATLSAMEGVSAIAIAAQGSWASIDTINKSYVSKAIALLGQAPVAVIKSIAKASNALSLDNSQASIESPDSMNIKQQLDLRSKFEELRDGYWSIVFHSDLSMPEKRGYASYFRSADKYVVEQGGESLQESFNATCENCGYKELIKK